MAERVSVVDDTFYHGYAIHSQRYAFAEKYCAGKRVLDAGCGVGYGSARLALKAESVVGVDIAENALAEARRFYLRDNLAFVQGNVERLTELPGVGKGGFDVVVNLENLEHLQNPTVFLSEASKALKDDGMMVISSPNGAVTERDESGKIANPFHINEYNIEEFRSLLSVEFRSIELYCQWMTATGKAWLENERMVFDNLSELYYNPFNRLGRLARRVLGKKCVSPPIFTAAGTTFPWEYEIDTHTSLTFPWEPDVLIAVCRK